MKLSNARALIFVVWLFATGIVIESTVTGCRSAPQTAFNVGTAATITVEAAMSGPWNAYTAAKHPSKAVEIKVAEAYVHYQAADTILLKAGKAMLAAQGAQPPDPNALSGAKLAWSQASAALVAASNDFFALLKDLGVKL